MAKLSQAFQFGRCRFAVEANDQEAIAWIGSKFLPCSQALPDAEVIVVEKLAQWQGSADIDSKTPQEQRSLMVSGLCKRLYDNHADCIWMDAAALCAPDGRLVLLTGPSCAGKSTLALGMSLVHGWKILSEDITLIDPERRTVLACPAPSGIRAGTAERLTDLGSLRNTMPAQTGWFFDPNLYMSKSMPAKFDQAVALEPLGESGCDAPAKMSLQFLSSYEYIKSVLPFSNLLRLDNKIGVLHEAVEQARCVKLSGGTLRERVEFLCQGGA